MKVVLVHPDIPWNTGNIGRTCVATETPLVLIEPLGFSLDDKQMQRAGLDYWPHLDLTIHKSLELFLKSDDAAKPLFLFSRFAERSLWEADFTEDSILVFGSETRGMPDKFKHRFKNHLYRIPTTGPVRSLNLSTAVGAVLFEAIRKVRGGVRFQASGQAGKP